MFDQARADEILGELRARNFQLPLVEGAPGYPLLAFDLSEGTGSLVLFADTDWCGEGESEHGKVFPMVNFDGFNNGHDCAEHDIWPNVHNIGPMHDADAATIAEHIIAWARTAVAWRGTLTR